MRLIAKSLLWLGGWTAVGHSPVADKAVVIVAPHTSNWDAIWALSYKVATGLDIRFFAKHNAFWFPLGVILRALGGIPLDRSQPGSAVKEAVNAFAENESFYFGLAPEGTRRLQAHWKSGFYRIAHEANVPVVLGFLDFGSRRVGLGPAIELSGNRDHDIARIREFYSAIDGCHPENATPVIFPHDD